MPQHTLQAKDYYCPITPSLHHLLYFYFQHGPSSSQIWPAAIAASIADWSPWKIWYLITSSGSPTSLDWLLFVWTFFNSLCFWSNLIEKLQNFKFYKLLFVNKILQIITFEILKSSNFKIKNVLFLNLFLINWNCQNNVNLAKQNEI